MVRAPVDVRLAVLSEDNRCPGDVLRCPDRSGQSRAGECANRFWQRALQRRAARYGRLKSMQQLLQGSVGDSRVYADSESHLSVDCGQGNQGELFRQVVGVRAAYPVGPYEFEFDRYSEHYLIRHHEQPIGVLTATRLIAGELDCAEYYPRNWLLEYGHRVFSNYKFRMLRSEVPPLKAVRAITGAMWAHQLSLGSRLLVINAAKSLIPLYRRMGLRVVHGSDFVHPTLGTESVVLVQASDPDCRSFFQDIFAQVPDPLRWRDLEAIPAHDLTKTQSSFVLTSR